MIYYIKHEDGTRTAVGELLHEPHEWHWIADPRSVREDEEVFDEYGKRTNLRDLREKP